MAVKGTAAVVTAGVILVCAGLVQAGIRADLSGDHVVDFATTMDMPFMAVGNCGNAPDARHYPYHGAVNYSYRIGKFEVTAGQYTEFLNAVAATDPHGLYSEFMDPDYWPIGHGCGIQRAGSAGSYTYSVAPDWEDRPVDWIGWGDTVRFANWVTNGMPTGAQDLTTTEDGSCCVNGATTNAELLAVTRKSPGDGGRYYVPTVDEWYKAAYHKNDGTSGNYFEYPTRSDTYPSNDLVDPDPGCNSNYHYPGGDYTVGAPYWRTEVGEFENSPSPYGAFDMGGNVWEWTEGLSGPFRTLWGGDYYNYVGWQRANQGYDNPPETEICGFGFRIVEVPEPASASLLALGPIAVLTRRRRRKE